MAISLLALMKMMMLIQVHHLIQPRSRKSSSFTHSVRIMLIRCYQMTIRSVLIMVKSKRSYLELKTQVTRLTLMVFKLRIHHDQHHELSIKAVTGTSRLINQLTMKLVRQFLLDAMINSKRWILHWNQLGRCLENLLSSSTSLIS